MGEAHEGTGGILKRGTGDQRKRSTEYGGRSRGQHVILSLPKAEVFEENKA